MKIKTIRDSYSTVVKILVYLMKILFITTIITNHMDFNTVLSGCMALIFLEISENIHINIQSDEDD